MIDVEGKGALLFKKDIGSSTGERDTCIGSIEAVCTVPGYISCG